jgi:hypothetical protein
LKQAICLKIVCTSSEIYKGKKFSSLLKDIVLNSEDRNRTIEKLIDDLRIMVKSPNDAILIIPLIKEYLDVTVKNDEQLIKLAAIVVGKDEGGRDLLKFSHYEVLEKIEFKTRPL